MKKSKIVQLIFIILLIGISMVGVACSNVAKKPAQPTPNSSGTRTETSPAPITPNISPAPNSTMEVANQAAMEAEKVMGVSRATAFVSSNIIYIGLDLNTNLDKTKSAAIEKTVMDRIKAMESGYKVGVTSDMNTVTAIKTVAQGQTQGIPISSFKTEMDMILLKTTPQ